MITLHRPGRVAAAAGAVVAVSATTLMAFVAGTAAADEAGRCLDNVNIREEPSADARIVAVCDAGTRVELGRTENGFVEVLDMGGWAAAPYVAAAASEGTPANSGASSGEDAGEDAEPGTEPEPTGRAAADEPAADENGPAEERRSDVTTTGDAPDETGADENGADENGTGTGRDGFSPVTRITPAPVAD